MTVRARYGDRRETARSIHDERTVDRMNGTTNTAYGLARLPRREIPLLDTRAQYHAIRDRIRDAVDDVLESGTYIMGTAVQRFEEAIADYCGVRHAVGVANGTDALLLTLDALGIGPGDEVITTPFTFFATAEAISRLGALPVFVDIEPDTYNLDASLLEEAVTPRTKAILPVHLFGQPAEMDAILELARRRGLYVVEDACQAIGAAHRGRRTGSLGHAGCFSFFPTKNLGGFGDGGMIVTDDDELARKLRILRVHGSNPKYYHAMIGYNSRLDPLQAAMLHVKLAHLDGWNKARRKKAEAYRRALQDLPLQLPVERDDVYAAYHLYIIRTERRDELMRYLQERGVASGVYYPVPLHRQEVYRNLGYSEGSLPEAERAAAGTMALPLYPEMSDEDQEYVIGLIYQFFGKDVV